MLRQLLAWIVFSLLILLIATYLPGVHVASFKVAMIAAVVMGLVNMLIKPVLSLLTLPFNLMTLGLFGFVLNALLFMLCAAIVPGFDVNGFWTALLASAVLAFISGLILPTIQQEPRLQS